MKIVNNSHVAKNCLDDDGKGKVQARMRVWYFSKIILAILLVAGSTIGAINLYWVHVAHRFAVITPGKVYKSGFLPDEKLKEIIEKYKIKTIVDLRKPKRMQQIRNEHRLALSMGIRHVNLPSDQVPKEETVQAFFRIMDDGASYPVLIHCYHGEGRAVLFSALYRIEYEHWENEKTRCACRIVTAGSSFSVDSSKGTYITNYTPRQRKN